MPRTPIRQQQGPFAGPNNVGRRRKLPPPVVRMPGPALAREHFGEGLPRNIARALNQSQANTHAAFGPVKALPFADGNLLENVTLVNGGVDGAGPFTILQHGLGRAFRGYDIKTVKGGYITAHCLIPNAEPELDASQMQLWVQAISFSFIVAPTADIWVYA